METRPLALNPTTLYIVVSAAVVVAAVIVFAVVRLRRRRREPVRSPYIDGLTRLVDGDPAGAFESLQQAVRAGNAPPDAYIRLGRMLRERGEGGRALQLHKGLTVREGLTRDEKVALFVEIAEDYAVLGLSDQAVAVLETAIRKLGLREREVFRVVAREAHRLGRSEDVYRYLKEWKKAGGIGDRELALYLTTAGASLLEKGNEREGRRTLERALKHDAECAPALLALGDADDARGAAERAMSRWREAVRISMELAPAALRRLERAAFQHGSFSEMEGVYREVLASRADDEAAVVSLARFYRKQGRTREAIDLLQNFRASHTDAVAPALLLTSLYASEHDTDAIEGLLEQSEDEIGYRHGYRCRTCGLPSDTIRWHCPGCNAFDSYETHTS